MTHHLDPDQVDVELDPVRAFLGCLMASGAERARKLLAGMRPTDAGPGIRGVAFELTLGVVAAGVAPDPRVLLAEARRRGQLDTEDKHQRFSVWLFDTYATAPYPEAGWFLRTAVLETAYRQLIREHAQRLLDAAEFADTPTLRALSEPDDALVDLWQRLAADLTRWGRDTDRGKPRPVSLEHRRAA